MSYTSIQDCSKNSIQRYELYQEIKSIELEMIRMAEAHGVAISNNAYSGQYEKIIDLMAVQMSKKTHNFLNL